MNIESRSFCWTLFDSNQILDESAERATISERVDAEGRKQSKGKGRWRHLSDKLFFKGWHSVRCLASVVQWFKRQGFFFVDKFFWTYYLLWEMNGSLCPGGEIFHLVANNNLHRILKRWRKLNINTFDWSHEMEAFALIRGQAAGVLNSHFHFLFPSTWWWNTFSINEETATLRCVRT